MPFSRFSRRRKRLLGSAAEVRALLIHIGGHSFPSFEIRSAMFFVPCLDAQAGGNSMAWTQRRSSLPQLWFHQKSLDATSIMNI